MNPFNYIFVLRKWLCHESMTELLLLLFKIKWITSTSYAFVLKNFTQKRSMGGQTCFSFDFSLSPILAGISVISYINIHMTSLKVGELKGDWFDVIFYTHYKCYSVRSAGSLPTGLTEISDSLKNFQYFFWQSYIEIDIFIQGVCFFFFTLEIFS